MTEGFTDGTVLRRSPVALYRRLLDGMLVLVPGMSEPIRVSTPGEVIWTLLAAPHSIAELADALSTLYEVPVGTIRADIEPVLLALCDAGALSANSPSP